MIKVMTIFGTRPEAIKMAPLVLELDRHPKIESVVCVTAQHRQMLDQVLELFNIKPDYDLDIMQQRQTLIGITTKALFGLDDVLKKEKPDMVLVHGDTTTSFVGSLAAFYNMTAIGHVEAGLRTFDKYSPYPEEMNRRLTGVMADLHFSPTKANQKNLLNEGVSPESIYITGNTVIDALKITVRKDYEFIDETLKNIDFEDKKVVLVTAHRRENLGRPLENICNALKKLANTYKEIEIVYPVHLNPAVRETAFGILGGMENVHLIDPLDVEELHNAMAKCYMVMTDSGGLQEEAPALGKPVLVLRTETERPEAVVSGTVKIAGVDENDILRLAQELIEEDCVYNAMAKAVNPYGDGNASQRIANGILYYFNQSEQRPSDF